MSKDLYQHPEIYDIACCSFRDPKQEPDGLDRLFRCYAQVPLQRVLDVACGPAPNAAEFVRRGYRYIGLDLSPSMLDYCRRKHADLGAAAEFICGDMRDFSLPRPVEAAIIIAGSFLASDARDALAILRSVARALAPGGLAVFDSCIQCPRTDPLKLLTYEIALATGRLSVTMGARQFDVARQTVDYELSVEVNDCGRKTNYHSRDVFQLFYPQEFLLLADRAQNLEFVGWWDGWGLTQQLGGPGPMKRPILAFRRI
jgi:SAM-dependent methyltransferase